MPATPTGRGAQVILTGAVRRAARGAAANSLHGNLDIKTNLELAGSISAGYSPDGRTATLAPAHDVTVLAPESELGDALGSGGGGGGPFLPTAGGTVAGPLTVTGQSLFNFVNGTQPIIFQGNAGLPSGPPGGVFSVIAPDGIGPLIASYSFKTPHPLTEWGCFGANGTLAAPTALQSGDIIGRFAAHGYQGAAYANSGMMQIFATESFTPTSTGTGFSFQGVLNGTTAQAEMLGIRNGSVGVGVAADLGYRLDVNSIAKSSRFLVTSSVTATNTALVVSGLTTAQAMPPLPANAALALVGSIASVNQRQAMLTGNGVNTLTFIRTGSLLTTPAATTTQPIGGIEAMGYDTTWTTTPNANVMLVSAGTWSAASHPAYITFGTTPINSVTLTEAGRFSPNGNLLLGLTTDGANKLDVVGAVRLNGSLGVFNTTPVAKQTVSGAKGSNAALASLIAALAAYGLITDTTGA